MVQQEDNEAVALPDVVVFPGISRVIGLYNLFQPLARQLRQSLPITWAAVRGWHSGG